MDEVLTGFRVTASGWYGREGVAGDLTTFGKVMGGGLPAAAFGGRSRDHGPAGADRAGLPGGHAVREPAGHRGRAGHPAGLHPGGLRAGGRGGRHHRQAGRRRAGCGRGAVPAAGGGQPVLGVPRQRAGRSGTSARPAGSPPRRTRRSSTPCWSGACTCRRPRSRRGSCPPRTTRRRSSGSPPRCPPPPRGRGRLGSAGRRSRRP